jgi:hypothetical protein
VTKAAAIPVREREADPYATHEDFHTIFNDGIKELYQLALLLTREPEKAEQILHRRRESCHPETPPFGQGGGFRTL